MPRFYVTIGPESTEEHVAVPSPTWIVDATDSNAASDHAEVAYRRAHPEVQRLRIRLTQEPYDR